MSSSSSSNWIWDLWLLDCYIHIFFLRYEIEKKTESGLGLAAVYDRVHWVYRVQAWWLSDRRRNPTVLLQGRTGAVAGSSTEQNSLKQYKYKRKHTLQYKH